MCLDLKLKQLYLLKTQTGNIILNQLINLKKAQIKQLKFLFWKIQLKRPCYSRKRNRKGKTYRKKSKTQILILETERLTILSKKHFVLFNSAAKKI